ncbi:hypothetical protein [Pseudomonas cremoricolorata]|uniref:hypothetical protein n=1 Tax=Pseudomonas cremoricolorata TaxID=157783 RepID=UPI001B7F7CA8
MRGIPKAWKDELDDRYELLTDPDSREAVLSEMAHAAWKRGEVGDAELSDMLELAEAGRLWALQELEFLVGLDEVFPIPELIARDRVIEKLHTITVENKPTPYTGGWKHLDIPVVHTNGGAETWLEFDKSRGAD